MPRQFLAAMSRQPALAVVAAYLTATLPLLVFGAAAVPPAIGGAHVSLLVAVGLGLAWRPAEERGIVAVLRDWAPLVLMPALYAELPYLIGAAGRGFHDATVLRWEQDVFGGQPARDFVQRYPNMVLANVLHLCYLLYYLLIFVPPALLYVRGRRLEFRHTVFALAATFAACFVMFVIYPVQGPRYLWPPAPARPDEPMRALALWVLAAGSSRGAAFPSSHMAVSVVQTWFALRYQRAVGGVTFVITVGIALGAVYGGFHYGVDMVAGIACGLAIAAAVNAAGQAVRARISAAALSEPAQATEPSASRATNAS